MISSITRFAMAGLLVLLTACGGSGGGDRADGVEPGPPATGGPVPPEPAPVPPPTDSIDVGAISSDDEVTVVVDGVSMASPPTVTFTLTVNGTQAVTGLTVAEVRFSLAELVAEASFGIHSWRSFIESQEDPVCRNQADVDSTNNQCTTFTAETDPGMIPLTALEVLDTVAVGRTTTAQATTENRGTLTDNGDGSWSYTYAADPGDPTTLSNMHRACMQFSLSAPVENACIDFVPQDLVDPGIGDMATSLDPGFYSAYQSRQIVTEETCNSCHVHLTLHGSRTQMDYCVSCHNPGTADSHSTNPMDFKVLVHRIHYARNLDSVTDGTAYKIWGRNNGEHDYSTVSYPQNMLNCTRCHAGQEDVDNAAMAGLPAPEAVVTPDGYNWASKPSPDTCIGCHESASGHIESQSSCAGCHGPGASNSVEERHRDLIEENARSLVFAIENISNTGPGESPVVDFTLSRDGTPIDIQNAAVFDGKVRIGIAWDAAEDFDNDGINFFASLNIEINAIAESTPIGGNVFRLDVDPATVAPGQDTVGVMLFGHEDLGGEISAITSLMAYSASEAATATPRRQVVDAANCNDCHRRLAMTDSGHAGFHAAPADNPDFCVGCHGPGLGFDGTVDFRVLVHGLHASGFRETPYKDFDETHLQYPGNLAECASCHTNDSHTLPLPVTSQPLLDTPSGSSDLYTTPVAAACGACHDGLVAASHMTGTGGAVIRGSLIEATAAVESCDVCHATGASADVDVVHAR